MSFFVCFPQSAVIYFVFRDLDEQYNRTKNRAGAAAKKKILPGLKNRSPEKRVRRRSAATHNRLAARMQRGQSFFR